MKSISIDIETNNLLSEMLDYSSFPYKLKPDSKIWVISFNDILTGETISLVKEEITKEAIHNILKDYDFIIQHNGIKFDLIVLKLMGLIDYKIGWLNEQDILNGKEVRFIDTLILSRLISPDRYGGHSLKSWGERVGTYKDNFRQECIDSGIITKDDPKGSEFKTFSEGMISYCEQDTKVTSEVFKTLFNDMLSYSGWKQAFKMETKLADLAIRRESLGFWFDKDLAVECVEDLTNKMEELRLKVNPNLPPKAMNKTDLNYWTPPKNQLKKDGTPSSHMIKFADKVGGIIDKMDGSWLFGYKGQVCPIPFTGALETTTEADISNLDHVKMTLIKQHGWNPTEWAERDFTKDFKKQSMPYEKRVKAFERWLKETTEEGKYSYHRLHLAFESFKVRNIEDLEETVLEKLHSDFPVRLVTSPKVRVGVAKDLCPALVELGEKVAFAKDFSMYLTYKHRKSSIAGGEIEDMDFDLEYPETGFLSSYREEDGRIPTPAIEIGASTNRYRHIGVCNIARATSVYGKEMRSLFGCGKGAVQYGFDYASLEARIQGHYCYKFTDGVELSETLLAEKPNDIHSLNSRKLGISRDQAKSITYAILYGCAASKLEKMLGITKEKAEKLYSDFWNTVPALKELKSTLESQWEKNGKQFIQAIDGRKLNVRSKHSIINLLFQSGGIICAKYVSVLIMERFEKQGLCIDPFEGKPDVCSMIEYHKNCGFAQ